MKNDHLINNMIAFIEGALNVSISQSKMNEDAGFTRLSFPSKVSESGWSDDFIEYSTAEELQDFLDNVFLLIREAREQQKGN